MRTIIGLTIIFLSFGLNAQVDTDISSIDFRIEEVKWDPTVDSNCAQIIMYVRYQDIDRPALGATIDINNGRPYYKVPKGGKVEILTDKSILSATITPLANKDPDPYVMGFFNKLKLKPFHSYHIYIGLKRAELKPIPKPEVVPIEPVYELKKPVLYLYPEKEIDIDIELQPYGEFTFTYPKYNGGWSAKVFPNGNIQIDGKNYPYLFWEAKSKKFSSAVRQSGFVVKAEETVAFLEEKLALMGLNEREMTDFITFWAPQLEQNPYNFMHFVRGDEYENQIAQMQLSQQPDSKIRIHLWYAPLDAPIQVKAQELDAKKRTGFTAVEWGGGAFDWMTP